MVPREHGEVSKSGRNMNPRKADYIQRFGLKRTFLHNAGLNSPLMDQLDRCADDEARRILLNSMGYIVGKPVYTKQKRAKSGPVPKGFKYYRKKLTRLPVPRIPVRSVPWRDYGDWSSERGPTVQRLMELSRRVG